MRGRGGLNCLADGGTPDPSYGRGVSDLLSMSPGEYGLAHRSAETHAFRPWPLRYADDLVDNQIPGAIHSIYSGATAPHDALSGQLQVMDPATGMPSQAAIDRSRDLAASTVLGAGAIPADATLREGATIARRARLDLSPEARLARAREQGYTIDAYHGTDKHFSSFDTKQSEMGTHVGTPAQAEEFSTYGGSSSLPQIMKPEGRTYPVRVKLDNPVRMREPDGGFWGPQHIWEQLKDQGKLPRKYDNAVTYTSFQTMPTEQGVRIGQQMVKDAGHDGIVYLNRHEGIPSHRFDDMHNAMVDSNRISDSAFRGWAPEAADSHIVFDPHQIRSTSARFDPSKTRSGDMLAATGLPLPGASPAADDGSGLPPSLTDASQPSLDPLGAVEGYSRGGSAGEAERKQHTHDMLGLMNTLSPNGQAQVTAANRYVDPAFMRRVDTAPVYNEDTSQENTVLPLHFERGGRVRHFSDGGKTDGGADPSGIDSNISNFDVGAYNNAIASLGGINYGGNNGNSATSGAWMSGQGYDLSQPQQPSLTSYPELSVDALHAAGVYSPSGGGNVAPTADPYASPPSAASAAPAIEAPAPSFDFPSSQPAVEAPASPDVIDPRQMDPTTVPGYQAPTSSFGVSSPEFMTGLEAAMAAAAARNDLPGSKPGSGLSIGNGDGSELASNVKFGSDPNLPSFAQAGYSPDITGVVDPTARSLFAESPTLQATATYAPMDITDIANWPAGMRNYNPANLKWSGSDWQKNNLPGMIGPSENTDQGTPQIHFSTPEDGMYAAARLAQAKYSQGLTTVNDLITAKNGWTPGFQPAADNIANSMGVKGTDQVDLSDPSVMKSFLQAVVKQEQGPTASQYPEGMFDAAVARLTGQTPGAAPQLSSMAYNVDPMDVVRGYTPDQAQQAVQVAGPAMAAPSYFNDTPLSSSLPPSFQMAQVGTGLTPVGSFAPEGASQAQAAQAARDAIDGGFSRQTPDTSYPGDGGFSGAQLQGGLGEDAGFHNTPTEGYQPSIGAYDFSQMKPSVAETQLANALSDQYRTQGLMAPDPLTDGGFSRQTPAGYTEAQLGTIASDQPEGLPGYGTIASDQPAGLPPAYGTIASDQPEGLPASAIVSLPYTSTVGDEPPPGTVIQTPTGTYKQPMDPREAFKAAHPDATETAPKDDSGLHMSIHKNTPPSTEMPVSPMLASPKEMKTAGDLTEKAVVAVARMGLGPLGPLDTIGGLFGYSPITKIADYARAHPADPSQFSQFGFNSHDNSGANGVGGTYTPTPATVAPYLPPSATTPTTVAPSGVQFSGIDRSRQYLGPPGDLLQYGFGPEKKMFASEGGYVLPPSNFG